MIEVRAYFISKLCSRLLAIHQDAEITFVNIVRFGDYIRGMSVDGIKVKIRLPRNDSYYCTEESIEMGHLETCVSDPGALSHLLDRILSRMQQFD